MSCDISNNTRSSNKKVMKKLTDYFLITQHNMNDMNFISTITMVLIHLLSKVKILYNVCAVVSRITQKMNILKTR